jgi:hypothetical protein
MLAIVVVKPRKMSTVLWMSNLAPRFPSRQAIMGEPKICRCFRFGYQRSYLPFPQSHSEMMHLVLSAPVCIVLLA